MSRPTAFMGNQVLTDANPGSTPESGASADQEELLEGLMQRSHKRTAHDAGLPMQAGLRASTPSSMEPCNLEYQGHQGGPQDADGVGHAMLLSDEDGHAEDGQAVDEHGHGQRQPEEGEEEEPLVVTETVAAAAQDMAAQLQAIEDKIQALVRVGVAHLDSIKENFVNEMNRYIQDLHAVCDLKHERWCGVAHETIHGMKRLDMAKQLVGSLGLATDGHPADGLEDMEDQE